MKKFPRLGTFIGLGVIKEGQEVDTKKNAPKRFPKWVLRTLIVVGALAVSFGITLLIFTFTSKQTQIAILGFVTVIALYLSVVALMVNNGWLPSPFGPPRNKHK